MATTKLLCSTAMLKTIENLFFNVLVKIYNHDARESTLLYLALLLAFHVLLQ